MRFARINSNNSGFTLVELLITVAIMGILAAVATPQILQMLPKMHTKGVTRDLASKLMVARLRAVQENKAYALVLTTGTTDYYTIKECTSNTAASCTTATNVNGEGKDTVDIVPASCLSSAKMVIFFPNGTAGTSGTISSCSSAEAGYADVITVVATRGQSYEMTIEVNSSSGHVKIR